MINDYKNVQNSFVCICDCSKLSSAPVFAQVDPDGSSTGSADVPTTNIYESISVDHFALGATEITVTVDFVDIVTGNEDWGFRIGVYDVDGNIANDDFGLSEVTLGEWSTLTKTIELVSADGTQLNTAEGNLLQVSIHTFETFSSIPTFTERFGEASTERAGVEQICGYEAAGDIHYGTLASGQTGTGFLTPSITNTERFIQPDNASFQIDSFKLGDLEVVEAQHTFVNGTAGPQVVMLEVGESPAFEFETTLNFVDSNAYFSSVGNTITQTTTITPECLAPYSETMTFQTLFVFL